LSRRGVGEALVKDLAVKSNNLIMESLQIPDPDQTIEVLMTDLDPEIMAIFTKEDSVDAKEATQVRYDAFISLWVFANATFQKSGINKIIPGMVIDDFLFEPCGYSMNGVSKNVSVPASVSKQHRNLTPFSKTFFIQSNTFSHFFLRQNPWNLFSI
jgi:hypothetical protein